MTDIIDRLSAAIHLESAAIAPQTSALIEAAKEAIWEIGRLRNDRDAWEAMAKTFQRRRIELGQLSAATDAGSTAGQAVHSPPVSGDKADAASDDSN